MADKEQVPIIKARIDPSFFETVETAQSEIVKLINGMNKKPSRMDKMLKRTSAALGEIFSGRKLYGAAKDWIETFGEFEQGLANVRAISGATAKETAALSKSARELGATTEWSAREVTDAQVLLVKAGYSVEETIEALPGLLSAASADQMDLAEATELVVGTLKSFDMEAAESARVADVLAYAASATKSDMAGIGEALKVVAPIARSLGYDIEQASAAIGLLSDAEIKGSEAGIALGSMLTSLAQPTKAAQKAMNRLGISAFDAEGKLLPLDEIIGQLAESTVSLTEQQRASDIADIFGQEAMSGVLALMEQGPERMRKLRDELHNSSGAAKRMADMRLDSLPGSFVKLQSAVEAAKISIGGKLAPEVKRLADMAADRLLQMTERFERTFEEMVNSPVWQHGDLFDKIRIAWNRIIAEPFGEWWNVEGRNFVNRVGNEVGSLLGDAILATAKKAFSFDGFSSLLAAGALAIPGVKIGKGVMSAAGALKKLGAAGGGAAQGVVGASSTIGLLARGLGMLTNPIGLAIAGVGILTAGVKAYRRHQEEMRQELINMGSDLQETFAQYESAADKAELTRQLSDEYRALSEAVKQSAGSTEELAAMQERMVEITETLQSMYPNILTNYDLERGKLEEKLALLQQTAEAEKETQKFELEAVVARGLADRDKLVKTIADIEKSLKTYDEKLAAINAKKDAYDATIPLMQQYEIELMRIQSTEGTVDMGKAIELGMKVNEAGSAVGRHFDNIYNLLGTTDELKKEQQEILEKRAKLFEERKVKYDEWNTAKASLESLYDAQVRLIELDLGAKIEEQASNYSKLTSEEKTRFDDALKRLYEINQLMTELPHERKINIEVLYNKSRGFGGVPDNMLATVMQYARVPTYLEGLGLSGNSGGGTANRPPTFGGAPQLDHFADGGFANRPSIFGEKGLEAAIPIDNRPRSHAILDRVNRLMGRDRVGTINVTFAPNITVNGRADSGRQVQQALQIERDRFERWFRDMIRNERRLGWNG